MATVTASEARSQFSELLSRAGYGEERVVISRSGKPVAVLMSVEDARLLEELEDQMDIQAAEEVLEKDNEPIPWQEAKEELDL